MARVFHCTAALDSPPVAQHCRKTTVGGVSRRRNLDQQSINTIRLWRNSAACGATVPPVPQQWRFGASAPAEVLYQEFGLTADNVAAQARQLLKEG